MARNHRENLQNEQEVRFPFTTRLSHAYDRIVQQLSILTAIVVALHLTSAAQARTMTEGDLQAAMITGEEVSRWVDELPNRPGSVGIFGIHVNAPLEADFAAILETEIVKNIRSRSNMTITSCAECRTPQVKVVGDRLIIAKGVPDQEAMQEVAKKNGVNTFLNFEVIRTKLSLITQATLIQAGSGEIIATERFKVPSLDFSDAALQFIAEAGPGVAFGGGISGSSQNSSTPVALNLLALEELGFGKGGLNFGTILGGNKGYVLYASPTLAWRGRFASSAITTLFDVGVGYGFANGSAAGINASAGYTVFLGSFTTIGIRGSYLFPLNSSSAGVYSGGYYSSDSPLKGRIAFQLGIALGR